MVAADESKLARYLFGEMTFGEYWRDAKESGRARVSHFEVLTESTFARVGVKYRPDSVEERRGCLILRNSNPQDFIVALMLDWNYKIVPTGSGLVVNDGQVRVAVKFDSDPGWLFAP